MQNNAMQEILFEALKSENNKTLNLPTILPRSNQIRAVWSQVIDFIEKHGSDLEEAAADTQRVSLDLAAGLGLYQPW